MNKIYCFGFLFFSKTIIRTFFSDEEVELVFVRSATAAIKKGFNKNSHIASWGKRGEQQAQILSEQFDVDIWRVEDGFIRSAGLGSDYSPPASLVIDKSGIYYDPLALSDLESILQSYDFDNDLLQRGDNIQQLLVGQSISKYNLGSFIDANLKQAIKGKMVVLIPGQVEDDASIKKGTVDIKTNTDLIKAVRQLRKDAFVIYKPHPDVVSGNRIGLVEPEITEQYCDAVLDDVSITDCLEIADEVHTMTSLVGMEALMRECKVFCYGMPFYAGWGLTEDQHKLPRRTRRLSLQALIAATYILYPRYVDWEQEQFCTPEYAIERIGKKIKQQGGKQINKVSRVRRQLRKLVNMGRGVLRDLRS